MRLQKQLFLLFVIVMMVGCKSIGPGRIHIDRGFYNKVVRDTEQEQLLANIVRGRYLESTQYVQVSGVTASYQLSETLSADYTANYPHGPTTYVAGITPSASYSDNPTISYTPLSNAEFATSLMTPVSMLNFLLLIHAGSYDQVALFDLFFEQLNYTDSTMLHRQGWLYSTQEQLKVWQIMRLLKKLQKKDAFDVPRSILYQKHLGIMIRFKKNTEFTRDAVLLKKLLAVDPKTRGIVFIEHSFDEDLHEENGVLVLDELPTRPRNTVYVRLRSMYSVIKYLGFGVQVPKSDQRKHVTRELIKPDGTIFDWSHKMKGVFTVYSSSIEPRQDIYIKVKVRHHWFYIKETDLASKDLLVALQRLYTLTSVTSSYANTLPVITIPVGAAR